MPPPPSCLFRSLHHAPLPDAISLLPLLARHNLRPKPATLTLLLRRCLLSHNLTLASHLLLYLHLTGLKHLYPAHTPLSNHILHLHFLRNQPSHALRLLRRMPSPNVFSFNAVLAGFARLGQVNEALSFFKTMSERDTVSWNTLIIALARSARAREAVEYFSRMRSDSSVSVTVNAHTFSGLLTACVRISDTRLMNQAHAQVIRAGFTSNVVVSSILLDGYAKNALLKEAHKVFDEMPERDVTAWTALVYGYAKAGELGAARTLFEEMPERNPVTWTAMIGGYARGGYAFEALDMFRGMVSGGFRPDQYTFSSGLCACGAIASLKHGKQIHGRMLRCRLNPNAVVLSSLVDMYSKCGDLAGGWRVFDGSDVSKRDAIMWNTMMSAFGQHGHGKVAIRLFEEMVGARVKPDANTFVVVLTSCNHSGLVSEGVEFFEAMAERYDFVPKEEHYVCLVDLLGRAGLFEEAMNWLRKMPFQSSASAWKALLSACRTHKNLHLGREAAEKLIELEPQSSAAYVLLSNIYAELGRWDSVERVRQLMEERKVRKERAISWISVDDIVHSFGVSDKLHPLKLEIYATLDQLVSQMDEDSSVT